MNTNSHGNSQLLHLLNSDGPVGSIGQDVRPAMPTSTSLFDQMLAFTAMDTTPDSCPYRRYDLFNDSDPTHIGRARSCYWGLDDAKWWCTFETLGPTRYMYNMLHSPFGFIAPTGLWRRRLIRIVDSTWFDAVIIALIVSNAFALAIDVQDTEGWAGRSVGLKAAEYFFLTAFTIETVMKSLAYGFVAHPGAYLRNGWHVVDFSIVLAGYAGLHPSVGNFTIVRLIRLLRPLRTISRIRGLRILINSLINALPSLADVALLILFFGFLFALVGVELWAGSYHQRCYVEFDGNNSMNASESTIWHLAQNVTSLCSTKHSGSGGRCTFDENGITLAQQCRVGSWRATLLNFDNVLEATLHVLAIMTLDNWSTSMERAQSVDSFAAFLFFVVLIFVGGYGLINLLLATLTQAYTTEWQCQTALGLIERRRHQRMKCGTDDTTETFIPITPATMMVTLARMPLSVYLSTSKAHPDDAKSKDPRAAIAELEAEEEEVLVESRRMSHSLRLSRRHSWVHSLYSFVEHKRFRIFFMGLALYNVAVIAYDHYGISNSTAHFIKTSTLICNVLFGIEMILKLIALGPMGYCADRFNVLDGVLVIISIPDMALSDGSSTFSALRAFRVLRVFVLVRHVKSIQDVLQAVVRCLHSVSYLSALIALYVFIMAIVGIQLFGSTEVPSRNNYSSFGQAMLTTFVLLTGEKWTSIMIDHVEATDNYGHVIYFLCVYYFGNMILVNQFVAILIDSFQSSPVRQNEGAKSTAPYVITDSTWWDPNSVYLPASTSQSQEHTPQHGSGTPPLVDSTTVTIDSRVQQQDEAHRKYLLPYNWYKRLFPPISIKQLRSTSRAKYLRRKRKLSVLKRSVQSDPTAIENSVTQIKFAYSDEDIDETTFSYHVMGEAAAQSLLLSIVRNPEHRFVLPCATRQVVVYPKSFSASDLITYLISAQYVTNRIEGVSFVRRNFVSLGLLTCVEERQLYWKEPEFKDGIKMWSMKSKYEQDIKPEYLLYGRSLTLFPATNSLRLTCAAIVFHPAFESVVVFVIIASAFILAYDAPALRRDDGTQAVVQSVDAFFTGFFLLEMMAKIIVYGAFLYSDIEPHHVHIMNLRGLSTPFFQSGINCLDAFVVLTSVIAHAVPTFRAFRCLRTLRLCVKTGRMRVVVLSLLSAIPAMFHLTVVLAILLLIYAVLGTQLLKGKMHKCSDPTISLMDNCVGSFLPIVSYDLNDYPVYSSVNVTREWHPSVSNYDSVAETTSSLFRVSMMTNWDTFMYDAMDSATTTRAREHSSSPWLSLYFVVFVLVGTFFALNLFVGLLVQTFSQLQRKFNGSALLTQEQREWVRDYKTLRKVKLLRRPHRPLDPIRRLCFAICEHEFRSLLPKKWGHAQTSSNNPSDTDGQTQNEYRYESTDVEGMLDVVDRESTLDVVVTLCVVVNVAIMAMSHRGQSEQYEALIGYSSYVFLSIYALEAALKIGAWDKLYFYNWWNIYDFAVVSISIASVSSGNNTVQTLMMVRMCRLVRLARQMRGLVHLANVILNSLPALLNIALLFFIILFNFAIVGMEMCGGAPRDPEGAGITDNRNFDDIAHSLLALLVVATRDNWIRTMDSCASVSDFSHTYFTTYMILGSVVTVNLFITVIMEIFTNPPPSSAVTLFFRQMELFRHFWSIEDPNADGKLHARTVLMILRHMPPPVGFAFSTVRGEYFTLSQLPIPVDRHGRVRYWDCAFAFARRLLRVDSSEVATLHRQVGARVHGIKVWTLLHWFTAMKIQRNYRIRKFVRVVEINLSLRRSPLSENKNKNSENKNDINTQDTNVKQNMENTFILHQRRCGSS
eukprot:PhM_4_TR16727/c0_g1_i2/m.78731